jgi:serine/threonine protein kinase
MGTVYEAFDTARGLMVALKAMHYTGDGRDYRLKREFRIPEHVDHPSVVNILDLIRTPPGPILVMELIDGVDFLAHVRGECGSATSTTGPDRSGPELVSDQYPRLRDALRQLVEGVSALHDSGVIHRDLKPSNILVTRDGLVKVTDFGLATERDGIHNPSLPVGCGAGTPAYMAPEQYDGDVSYDSDWYSVGVVLYEALTGRRPFVGSRWQVQQAKRSSDPDPPRKRFPEVPEDLDALCMDLLRRDPRTRPSSQAILERLRGANGDGAVAPAPASIARADIPLIGRRRHLEELRDAYDASTRGRTVVRFVRGRSGVGKTHLVTHFLNELKAHGAVILSGRCYLNDSVEYKALDPLIDELGNFWNRLPAPEAKVLMPTTVGPLTQVFPGLQRVEAVALAPRRPQEAPDPQQARRKAVDALRDILERLRLLSQPLVLFIDDLQRGDADSAAILADVLRPPDPPPLLLLGCYRSEDEADSPFLRTLLASLGESGEGLELRPPLLVEGLSQDEARELARASIGGTHPVDEARIDAIARESGGIPQYVDELVRWSRDQPDAPFIKLDEAHWALIRRLSDDARHLLEVVAVNGGPLRREDARQALGKAWDERPALKKLRLDGLVRERVEEVDTYHDRVRETVLAHLAPEDRRGHHLRLGRVFEGSGRDAEAGAHLRDGGEPRRAGACFARAAEQAVQALAFDRAATLYRQALALRAEGEGQGEGRRLRAALGDALANAGRGAEAAGAYLEAARGAERAEGLKLRRLAAMQYLISGHMKEGFATLEDVLRELGMEMPSLDVRTDLWVYGQHVRFAVGGCRCRRRERVAANEADLARVDACWSAAAGLSVVAPFLADYFHLRGLEGALRAGDRYRVARSVAMEAAHLAAQGRMCHWFTCRRLADAASRAAEFDDPYLRGNLEMARGIAAYLEGRFREGVAGCDRADEIFKGECHGVAWERDTAHSFALWSLIRLGELAEVARRRPGLLAEARERGDVYAVTNLSTYLMSWIRLAADEPGEALREARVIEGWSGPGYSVQHNDQASCQIMIDLYTGRGQAAWDRVTQIWGPLVRSRLLRVQYLRVAMLELRGIAALAAAAEQPDPRRLLSEARYDAWLLRREMAPWPLGLARLLRAGLASAGGDLPAARAHAAEAIRHFEGCGMALHAASARRRLGELIGGDEGLRQVAAADAWMGGEGIRNPERMAAVCSPDLRAIRGHPRY